MAIHEGWPAVLVATAGNTVGGAIKGASGVRVTNGAANAAPEAAETVAERADAGRRLTRAEDGSWWLRIGDERFTVGPGDFAGFPPRTHAHHLRNTGAEDLVYLSGGEALDHGIADFPELGKRMIHVGKEAKVYPLAEGKDLF